MGNNQGVFEEMNRQIGFLRDDVKSIIQSQADLQKIVLELAKRDASAIHISKKDIESIGGSNTNLGGVDENVTPHRAR